MFVKNVCDYPYAFLYNGQKITIPNDNRIYMIPDDVDINLIHGFLAYKKEHKHIDVDVKDLKISIDLDAVISNKEVETPEIINNSETISEEVVVETKVEPEIVKPSEVKKIEPKKEVKKVVAKKATKPKAKN